MKAPKVGPVSSGGYWIVTSSVSFKLDPMQIARELSFIKVFVQLFG